jgi:membrane-associated phospholipid phosphatase
MSGTCVELETEHSAAAHIASSPVGKVQPQAVDPQWDWPFHLAMVGVTLGVLAISGLGYLLCELTVDLRACAPLAAMLLVLAIVAAQYAWRGETKCFTVVMMVVWVVLITNCHFFPMYMAARTQVPMNDALLARCDSYLGIEVPAVRAVLADYPRLNAFLLITYGTLIPLMTVAVIVPPLLGHAQLAKRFVVSCIIAATISLPIFACLQAVGPWEHFGFPPAIDSLAAKAQMLATLKSAGTFVIDVNNRDGLITFPSFHVVLTVLAAITLWPIRYLRWPAAIWAALIVISTVTTGIHYSIDVVGGLVLAIASHAGAKAILGNRTANYLLAAGRLLQRKPLSMPAPE